MNKRGTPSGILALDGLLAVGLAVVSVVWVNYKHTPLAGLEEFLRIRITLLNLSFAIVFAIAWKYCLTLFGLYRRDLVEVRGMVGRTAGATALMSALLAMYLEARHARGPIDQIVGGFLFAAFLYELLRVVASSRHVSWQVVEPKRVVILGSGRLASKAWRELRLQNKRTQRLLGFIDDRSPECMPPDIASRLLGKVDDLPGYLLRTVVDELIVATPMRSCYDLSQRAVSIAEAAGVRVVCLHDVFALTQQKNLRHRESLFVELVPRRRRRLVAETAKRVLDVLGAATCMLLLAPVFLSISLALKLTTPGSIFSVQERHGYARRQFRMFKFRSAPGEPTQGSAPYLGNFLRRSLLDKLPELWNVLLGDMSLVGPEPMSAEDVSHFNQSPWLRRFSVRPGMTGNWQVAAPARSFEEWAALDFSYIDEWSFTLDLKILARTLPALLKRGGESS